jgi:hypothetical protein
VWTVLALGIVNAGKSSVLSALADKPDLFPSGDLPRITRVVERQRAGPLLLVDTPGLDADNTEADQAMRQITDANTILWCHSLRMGELHAAELAALRRCRVGKGTIRKTCFVLTHEGKRFVTVHPVFEVFSWQDMASEPKKRLGYPPRQNVWTEKNLAKSGERLQRFGRADQGP